MRSLAVQVNGLSKVVRTGETTPLRTLREALMRVVPSRSADRSEPAGRLWALRDVSFEVSEGEALGIIGANGAGKSTLLKLLARITHPTRGEARIRGKVGALIEAGTGFHPDLTGGENVYLSGAILGMSRAEVRKKFDEIIAFADLESFVDTPIKRYSTGMACRLGFSVAAHVDPDVLLVDEVLAVGDAAFRKKGLAKMRNAREAGSTILFVSHNLDAVRDLCDRTVWLDHGQLRSSGPSDEVCTGYLHATLAETSAPPAS